MESTNFQLTPEQRQVLLAHPNEPVYIADEATQKIYVVVEKGTIPQLEDTYIREGLELARSQIAQGSVSTASVAEIVAKAQQRNSAGS